MGRLKAYSKVGPRVGPRNPPRDRRIGEGKVEFVAAGFPDKSFNGTFKGTEGILVGGGPGGGD